MDFAAHLDGLAAAGAMLRENAAGAGWQREVPTCPGWTVRDLVVHQGMVHRWAIDVVSGRGMGDGAGHEGAGRAADDLLGWFDEGLTELLDVLAGARADLDVPFFLRTGDGPRDGWTRRQLHETAIHAVDALAARLGRAPTPDETGLTTELAVDGLAELLLGFIPRKRIGQLRSVEPITVVVDTTDTDHAWTLRVSSEPTSTEPGAAPDPDVVLRGPAVALYLALWNRTDGAQVEDESRFLDKWRREVVITWA